MTVLHAVPALLDLLHDTEDEDKTMSRGCGWMRRHTGADAVGICAGAAPRLLASDGIVSADLRTPEIDHALREPCARTVVVGMLCIVTSPVRFAGQTIGAVIAKGRPELAEALTDAGAALASLLAGTLRSRLDAINAAGHAAGVAPEILGRSPSIGALRQSIAQAAVTTFAVLIEGESGTGKELVARALHRLGPRRDRRLCAVNCAALTDELIEAELFGYTRGAFTGAIGARVGLFEEAHHGTLFLDEVGELTPRAQAKLLRALQEREIRRLGENTPRPVDVRVIAATNVALQDAAALGRFREDLLFRLAVIRIRVPPLRDRVEDVPLLALAFWRQLTRESPTRAVLAPDALSALCRHRWPGNIRELQNIISALVVTSPPRGRVHARHVAAVLASASSAGTAPSSLESAIRGFERSVVAAALARNGGHRTRAAAELGLTRQGLTKAIRRLGLSADIGKIA
jgi:transcriptional regulator with PAS, ATPase and Fis domain